MKAILSVITSFFLFAIVELQAQEKVVVSVDYLAKYKTSQGGFDKVDEMRLDAGRTSSHFYSLYAMENQKVIDSLTKANRSKDIPQEIEDRGTGTAQRYQVYKNHPKGFITYTDYILKESYSVVTPKDDILWVLSDKDSLIMGYKCYMASAHYLGRQWTVWYTPAITIPEGPWKLYGLPGLILFAEDSTQSFSFSCIGLRNAADVVVGIPEGNYKNCTMKQLNNMYRVKVENPMRFMQQAIPEGLAAKILENEDVKRVFSQKRVAVLLEE